MKALFVVASCISVGMLFHTSAAVHKKERLKNSVRHVGGSRVSPCALVLRFTLSFLYLKLWKILSGFFFCKIEKVKFPTKYTRLEFIFNQPIFQNMA